MDDCPSFAPTRVPKKKIRSGSTSNRSGLVEFVFVLTDPCARTYTFGSQPFSYSRDHSFVASASSTT
jgi:hypothetical protein